MVSYDVIEGVVTAYDVIEGVVTAKSGKWRHKEGSGVIKKVVAS